jgi:hypothetical protein
LRCALDADICHCAINERPRNLLLASPEHDAEVSRVSENTGPSQREPGLRLAN